MTASVRDLVATVMEMAAAGDIKGAERFRHFKVANRCNPSWVRKEAAMWCDANVDRHQAFVFGLRALWKAEAEAAAAELAERPRIRPLRWTPQMEMMRQLAPRKTYWGLDVKR